MKKSILTNDLEHCLVCGTNQNIHIHHVFYGTAKRKLSDKHGLIVPLCASHHNMSKQGVHQNKILDTRLKQFAQRKFEEQFPQLNFLKIFGKNYL